MAVSQVKKCVAMMVVIMLVVTQARAFTPYLNCRFECLTRTCFRDIFHYRSCLKGCFKQCKHLRKNFLTRADNW